MNSRRYFVNLIKKKCVKYTPIIYYTGYDIPKAANIPTLKKDHYFIVDKSIPGDAPKSFLKLYEFRKVKKQNYKKWIGYIVKTGHKWYPIESITEYLLCRIGEVLGVNMAKSKIMYVGGQIRFFSEYFLKENQSLIHGADIYAGFFNDEQYVLELEENDLSRNVLTLQITRNAITSFFNGQSNAIFESLIKLLLFDAFIGNNDRHFYNWGVITDIFGKHDPYFSPIYDTARGLFWNFSEAKILNLINSESKMNETIQKYTLNSKPKIGWENENNINHLNLIKNINSQQFGISCQEINDFYSIQNLNKVFIVIDNEFKDLLSDARKFLIKNYLQTRFNEILKVI